MGRIDLVWLALLVASALYLVQVSYESRRLFAELDREQTRAVQIEGEHERLLLEAREQAASQRVERVAREKLGMRAASPAVTEYVDAPMAAATVRAPAAGGSR